KETPALFCAGVFFCVILVSNRQWYTAVWVLRPVEIRMNSVLFALTLALSPVVQGTSVEGARDLPPSPEQVLSIPDELRAAFRREVVDATRFPEARLEKL